MKRTLLVLGMIVALVGFWAISQAQADPELKVILSESPYSSQTVIDTTGTGDLAGQFNLTYGDFSINLGSASAGLNPLNTDLSSVDATASGSFTGTKTLEIELTYSNLTSPASGLVSVAITNTGHVVYGNGSESSTVTIGSSTFNLSGFNNSLGTTANVPAGTFSITDDVYLTMSSGAKTSIDSSIAATPEPATLFLYGALLLGLGFLRRYHWKAKA